MCQELRRARVMDERENKKQTWRAWVRRRRQLPRSSTRSRDRHAKSPQRRLRREFHAMQGSITFTTRQFLAEIRLQHHIQSSPATGLIRYSCNSELKDKPNVSTAERLSSQGRKHFGERINLFLPHLAGRVTVSTAVAGASSDSIKLRCAESGAVPRRRTRIPRHR